MSTISEQHSDMVKRLMKPGQTIYDQITPEKLELLHMAVGICGEAGELLDAVKKHVFYNKPLDIANVIEESGDLDFYEEGLRQVLNKFFSNVGLLRETFLEGNIQKLDKRYHTGNYSDQQAQARADKPEGQ